MQLPRDHRILWIVLALAGCNPSPKPSDAPADQTAIDRRNAQVASTNDGTATTLSDRPAATVANSAPSTVEGAKPAEQYTIPIGESDKPAAKVTPTPNARAAPPASSKVRPTPEQLKSWGHIPFEPLQLLACQESEHTGFASSLVVLPKGNQFVTAGTKVALWSLNAKEPVHTFLNLAPSTKNSIVLSIGLSSDGRLLAAGDSEGQLVLWDIETRKEVVNKKLYPTGIVQVAFSPDTREIATISYENEVSIWSPESLELKKRFKVDTNGIKRLEYAAPGQLAVAGETSSLWNTTTGKSEHKLSAGRYNYTFALSPNGGQLLFSDRQGLKFWSLEEAKIQDQIDGNFATNELASFSPQGNLVATANGATVRLWQSTNHQLSQVIDTFGSPIVGFAWLPGTNLLLVASENGRVRVWGTGKDGDSFGLKPLHGPVQMPKEKDRVAATPAQLVDAIDLRCFPRLPSTSTMVIDPFHLSYNTAVSLEEAKHFHRYFLQSADWVEQPSATPENGAMNFRKGSWMLDASFYDAGNANVMVNISFGGNYDLRWAPRFDAAPTEKVFENENTVMEKTKADLLSIETNLLKKMSEAGWVPYSRLHSSHSEAPNRRDLEFLQNALSLHVSISTMENDPPYVMIQYARFMMPRSLPIPKDSTYIEFDGSTEPSLVATTKMSLEEARNFYDQELSNQGWIVSNSGRIVKEEYNWLTYFRQQTDLTIGLTALKSGETRIQVGSKLENSSWQLAKPEEPSEPVSNESVISYEAWLRLHQHPATLGLLEKYSSEMRAINP